MAVIGFNRIVSAKSVGNPLTKSIFFLNDANQSSSIVTPSRVYQNVLCETKPDGERSDAGAYAQELGEQRTGRIAEEERLAIVFDTMHAGISRSPCFLADKTKKNVYSQKLLLHTSIFVSLDS